VARSSAHRHRPSYSVEHGTNYKHPDGTPFPAEGSAGFQALHAGKTLTGHEDVFIRKDGTFFDVVFSSAPLREGSDISGLVVVFSDVSNRKITEQELKRNNEALRHANADLEQFAYSASHDLQEPIRNIAVSGYVLSRRYGHLLDAKGKEYLSFMTGGARRMESMLKDLLAYTQSASADGEADGYATASLPSSRLLTIFPPRSMRRVQKSAMMCSRTFE
jgi:signal transduction histidine kinase